MAGIQANKHPVKAKKNITIASCVSKKPRARRKWDCGIYCDKQARRMSQQGLSDFKIKQIIKKNRRPLDGE